MPKITWIEIVLVVACGFALGFCLMLALPDAVPPV